MRKFFSRSTPPGIDAGAEIKHLILWLSLAAGFSLGTLANYLQARAELYQTVAGRRELIEGAIIEDFTRLTGAYFEGFTLVAVAILGLTVFHYSY